MMQAVRTNRPRSSSGFAIQGKRRRSVMSMAPLIDFTFILLIFFMVVTQFDRFTPVDVTVRKAPVRTMPRPPRPAAGQGVEKLHLRVRADGFFELNGDEIGDIDSFTGVLAHHQPREKENAKIKPLLLVDPDGEVSVQLLIDTMNALKTLPGFAVRIVMKDEAAAQGDLSGATDRKRDMAAPTAPAAGKVAR